MDCSYIKSKKEMLYISIILLMDKKVNAKRIASAKFRKAKIKRLLSRTISFGLPGENRTHNRNLGGSRYIHLTTGRFLYF